MSKKGRFIAWTLVALVVFGSPPALWGGRGNPGEKEKHLGEQVLNKATAYLHAKQSADGAWRSETYGLLKSGQSLTPFVLFALTESLTGNRQPDEEAIRKALGFLRIRSDPDGVLGRADPDFLDYPNYSTAYALRSFLRFGNEDDRARIGKMTSYLEAQFSEEDGFAKFSRLRRLGFGIKEPTLSSFVDLSHTRRVLVSLAQVKPVNPKVRGGPNAFSTFAKKPAGKKIPPYPWLHQGKTGRPPHDGGFFSSPTVAYANKGRTSRPKTGHAFYRSYATATCDGILCRPRDRQDRPPHHFRRPMAAGQ